ncbi:MAG: phosphoribosylformylglycinamidine synthase subunit PurQ [Armatimonadetes bacterium]|nr:phosphoribosylformylglycinamidine synthase subunit PurQ [Armatimonadota bacterium]
MKIGVVMFPGSNCDRDAACAWADDLGLGESVFLWHTETAIPAGIGAVVVPGGFSYGDALRAGAIACFAPIMTEVAAFAKDGGFVLGICNGFQVLCESGLLPGALVRNEQMRFLCRPVNLRVETTDSPFTNRYTPGEVVSIPVAHGEGRYVCSPETLAELHRTESVLFRYCEPDGTVGEKSAANGSQDNIAGIIGGVRRNILGMMPHPERAVLPRLGSEGGAKLWYSLRESLAIAGAEPVFVIA